ncbi:hypothetical protein DENSPDRAFT_345545 [Dentipellis sp. KUC8613]|nr:hypothetical protein DENSPDRAFT_345545 [Dentipellis sp. KUC8613]
MDDDGWTDYDRDLHDCTCRHILSTAIVHSPLASSRMHMLHTPHPNQIHAPPIHYTAPASRPEQHWNTTPRRMEQRQAARRAHAPVRPCGRDADADADGGRVQCSCDCCLSRAVRRVPGDAGSYVAHVAEGGGRGEGEKEKGEGEGGANGGTVLRHEPRRRGSRFGRCGMAMGLGARVWSV